MNSAPSLSFYAVYAGRGRPGHACIARARDAAHALRAARSNGIVLTRAAWAEALTVQQYAKILRTCGLKVAGVPEQMEMMTGAA